MKVVVGNHEVVVVDAEQDPYPILWIRLWNCCRLKMGILFSDLLPVDHWCSLNEVLYGEGLNRIASFTVQGLNEKTDPVRDDVD